MIMPIPQNNKVSFTGMNARHLKGVFLTSDIGGIASELKALKAKTDLDVFSLDKEGNIVTENFAPENYLSPFILWAQDLFSFTDKKLFIETSKEANPATNLIKNIGKNLQSHFSKELYAEPYHFQGGNYIDVNINGQREVLVGSYDIKSKHLKALENRFKTDKIHKIPQVAAHLDAFMFVDDKKRAFVCDDELTIRGIAQGLDRIENHLKNNFFKNSDAENYKLFNARESLFKLLVAFNNIAKTSPYAKTNEAITALEKAGYETIRIPARIYQFINSRGQTQHQYGTNFANGIIHKNKAGETIFITNKSSNDLYLGLDEEFENKTRFSFKKMFEDSVSPYIKKENIHYIQGEKEAIPSLLSCLGGMHCISSEII